MPVDSACAGFAKGVYSQCFYFMTFGNCTHRKQRGVFATRGRNLPINNPFWVYPVKGFILPPGMSNAVNSPDYKRFRELLVQARKDRGLTQAELSSRLNRPQSFVSKYERGERRLDVIEFAQVARALGVDPIKFIAQIYRGVM